MATEMTEVVANGVEIIQAVGHDLGLLVRLGFHVLFDAGVQEPHIRDGVDHCFTIQFEQQPEHTVGGGVLRSQVQEHRFASDGTLGDQVLYSIDGGFF